MSSSADSGAARGAAGNSEVAASQPSDDAGVGTALPPPIPAPGCSSAVAATMRPLDIYLLVDTNISLPLAQGLDNVRAGLSSYVDDRCAAGVSVGVRYFGLDCTAATYATPNTPVALLPQNATAIKHQMPINAFNLSPTLPAVQGGLIYSRLRAVAYPDSKQIIMLLSDGFSDFYCAGPDAIQGLFTAKPPTSGVSSPDLPIYVLALDVPGLANMPAFAALINAAARFGPLDSIAQGGGTGKAQHIDLQASAADFAQSMVAIQHAAQPCDYVVPDFVRKDPSGAALAMPDSTGAQAPLRSFDSAASCGMGYYLDDPKTPAWATLCPATCTELKARCARPAWVTGCAPK